MSLTSYIPQLIHIGLALFYLGVTIAKRGQPKRGKRNFSTDLVSAAIIVGLLVWGGFFAVLKAPQIIWLSLNVIALGVGAAEHGKPRKGVHSVTDAVISIALNFGLYYWGGFFG